MELFSIILLSSHPIFKDHQLMLKLLVWDKLAHQQLELMLLELELHLQQEELEVELEVEREDKF
jgi:hypothetical protein